MTKVYGEHYVSGNNNLVCEFFDRVTGHVLITSGGGAGTYEAYDDGNVGTYEVAAAEIASSRRVEATIPTGTGPANLDYRFRDNDLDVTFTTGSIEIDADDLELTMAGVLEAVADLVSDVADVAGDLGDVAGDVTSLTTAFIRTTGTAQSATQVGGSGDLGTLLLENGAPQDGLAGSLLLITGGTGVGQCHQIGAVVDQGGGDIEVVINDAWRVLPDATSTYMVVSACDINNLEGEIADIVQNTDDIAADLGDVADDVLDVLDGLDGVKLAADGLDALDYNMPTDPMPTTWPKRMMKLFWHFCGPGAMTADERQQKNLSGDVVAVQDLSDDGETQTHSALHAP